MTITNTVGRPTVLFCLPALSTSNSGPERLPQIPAQTPERNPMGNEGHPDGRDRIPSSDLSSLNGLVARITSDRPISHQEWPLEILVGLLNYPDLAHRHLEAMAVRVLCLHLSRLKPSPNRVAQLLRETLNLQTPLSSPPGTISLFRKNDAKKIEFLRKIISGYGHYGLPRLILEALGNAKPSKEPDIENSLWLAPVVRELLIDYLQQRSDRLGLAILLKNYLQKPDSTS